MAILILMILVVGFSLLLERLEKQEKEIAKQIFYNQKQYVYNIHTRTNKPYRELSQFFTMKSVHFTTPNTTDKEYNRHTRGNEMIIELNT